MKKKSYQGMPTLFGSPPPPPAPISAPVVNSVKSTKLNKTVKLGAVKLKRGDNIEALKAMADNSIDACVTDAPYGLSNFNHEDIIACYTAWLRGDEYIHKGAGFMNKKWDNFIPALPLWREIFRVLKPGGHLLCFAGTRTVGLMDMSIRLAGFEIRDTLAWIYAQGMPKSLDISKAIDRELGMTREVIGQYDGGHHSKGIGCGGDGITTIPMNTLLNITAPASEMAKKYAGFGTQLKPCIEPLIYAQKPLVESVILARKPVTEKTIAQNVIKYGTGGINIDACRLETAEVLGRAQSKSTDRYFKGLKDNGYNNASDIFGGRFPGNVMMDETSAQVLDETTPSKLGGASRFMFCPKVSPSERNGSRHPTMKPLRLMEYLCALVTPVDGVILDPFMGSGTTGVAAISQGFNFIGLEREPEYFEIAKKRIKELY
jgi:site-specific DNA-methyltransferase (adenine-specific)